MVASMSDTEVTALIIIQIISVIIILGLNTRCLILEKRLDVYRKHGYLPMNSLKNPAIKAIIPNGANTKAITSFDENPALSKNKINIHSTMQTANAYIKKYISFPVMIKKHIKRSSTESTKIEQNHHDDTIVRYVLVW